MATTKTTLTTTYTKIADSGDEFLLSFPTTGTGKVDVATADTDSAPASTVLGHRLTTGEHEAINRALIGPGYVFARAVDGSISVALTTWTP